MGFQVNGVEYVNSSGVFTNGLKTAQGTAMTGTGSMTTNTSAVGTFGTTRNSVGSIALGVAHDNLSTYSGTPTNSFNTSFVGNTGVQYAGMEPLTGSAGSSIRDMIEWKSYGAYPLNEGNWRITNGYWQVSNHLSGQTSGTDYIANYSGTWTPIANYMEWGTSYRPSSIYMRIS
tara:strand:+ start:652 stop:1173 length:522 start_codon:yes stop_codon:yes gene_type:complete